MDILILIEIRIDAERSRTAADIGHGGLGRFLHHIAEIAGKLKASGTVNDGGLNVQNLAADGGVGKAADKADLVTAAHGLRLELGRAEQLRHTARAQGNGLELFLGNTARRLAADVCDLALKVPDAGFSGVGGDYLPHCAVVKLELAGLQAMLAALLRDKVLLCDLELFFICIAGKLDDLHTVEQRSGNCISRIGSGDEKYAGQVKGQLKEVIAEAAVLLTVKGFEQCGRRVAPVIGGELVYLVENHKWVAGAGLYNAADDAPRHGAYVGAAVAAYLGFVMHAAKGDAHELAVRRRGDALGDTGLARARRADKADKPALDIRAELLYGEVFEHTFLDLIKAKVIVIELFARLGDINGLLRGLAPRYLKANVKIVSQNCGFGGAEGLLLETSKLLEELFTYLVAHRERLNFRAVLLDIVILAELGLDGLHLLAQVILALIARHRLKRAVVELLLDAEDIQLMIEELVDEHKAARGVKLFKDSLLVFNRKVNVLRDIV